MNTIDLEITRLMDEHIAAVGGAVTISETRQAILPAVKALIADSPRDLDAEASRALRTVTESARDQRRVTLKKELEFIIDALDNPITGAHLEPYLNLAYPLGTTDGSDKTLRYWTRDDFQMAITSRYRNAAVVTVSAKEFDDAAKALINRMETAGATTLGDLHGAPSLTQAA